MRGACGQGHPISLTTAEEKFIRYETQSRSEYFHLASDPGEQHPLTDDARAVALDATLASNLGEHTTTAKSERVETIPPRLLEQLKALGYVQ